MKFFIAHLATETNTFAAEPTGLGDFDEIGLGARERLGDCAWVEAGNGLRILLASIRTQTYGVDAFSGAGVTLADKAVVVVKSTRHFHAEFALLAR